MGTGLLCRLIFDETVYKVTGRHSRRINISNGNGKKITLEKWFVDLAEFDNPSFKKLAVAEEMLIPLS